MPATRADTSKSAGLSIVMVFRVMTSRFYLPASPIAQMTGLKVLRLTNRLSSILNPVAHRLFTDRTSTISIIAEKTVYSLLPRIRGFNIHLYVGTIDGLRRPYHKRIA